MINNTRLKMLNKEKTIGTFFELGTANAVEGLGYNTWVQYMGTFHLSFYSESSN